MWLERELNLQPRQWFRVSPSSHATLLRAVTTLGSLPQHSRCLSYSRTYFSFLFPVKSVLKSKKEAISPLGSTLAKRPSGPLEVGTPFYQDGQLQVRVYWKNRGGMYSPILIYSVF